MYTNLLELIENANKIVIFKHQRCDGDAMFSSLALKSFINLNYPEKSVKIAGKDLYDRFPYSEEVLDEDIKNSLAIILDTANLERCDDDRYALAKDIVKIDHHPNREAYGTLQIVDPDSAATCELLGEIFFSEEFSHLNLNEEICRYLCCGLLTDTLNFKTSSTTSKTLLVGSKIIEKGNLHISDLNELMFNVSLDSYQKITKLRNYLQIREKLGYLILKKEDLFKIGMSASDAKNQVSEFGGIEELNAWCIFVENDNGTFDGSLRSKRGYVVNSIANEYGGGGHACAAGIKNLSIKQVNELLEKIRIECQKSL